jgi:hypothetical protein
VRAVPAVPLGSRDLLDHLLPRQRLTVLFALALSLFCSNSACADGGTVRFSEVVSGYRVSLFTSPSPLRAGPVDISVLVQDADSSKPVPDVKISIRLTPRGRPMSESITHPATAEAATNKLLQAALFDLPEAGWWEIAVTVDGPAGHAEARCEVEVFEPWPHWLAVFPWIAWPIIPIVLFLVHQVLVSRRAALMASHRQAHAP